MNILPLVSIASAVLTVIAAFIALLQIARIRRMTEEDRRLRQLRLEDARIRLVAAELRLSEAEGHPTTVADSDERPASPST